MLFPKNSKPCFYFVFPNIFGFKGGVQVYSTFLLQAWQNLYPQANFDVFLKYDKQAHSYPRFLAKTRFHYFGWWPRVMQSILLTVAILLRGFFQPPQLLIMTHVNYSIVGNWLKQFAGVPYWVIVHGEEVWNLKNPRLQRALRNADKIIAVSHYTRDRLLTEQKINGNQIKILPNTFDSQRFQIAPKPQYLLDRYGLKAEQPVILTVTRLGRSSAEGKGYRQVIKALVQIRRQIPNVHYLLAGKGDDIEFIKHLLSQLGLTDCVTLTGFIPDDELCDHYNICDVFALPSCIEGFGIVYLEALACGKPILAGNRDGAVDPLDGGNLGVLVNPENLEDITHHLISILQGTCDQKIIYQPEKLREKTVKNFDFARFQSNLANLRQYSREPHKYVTLTLPLISKTVSEIRD